MSAIGVQREMLDRLQTRFVRWFFANFFTLLLLAVSVSEWGVLWWLLPPVRSLPLAGQCAGAALIHCVNRWLAMRTRRHRRDRHPMGAMPRLYYAVAFTSLFCFAFLLLTGTVWITARVFLGAIAVQAGTSAAGLVVSPGVDTVFRWLANAGVTIIGLVFAYGYTIGQRHLRVTRLRLPPRNFAPLSGLRIAHISDIHIGQNLDPEDLERFVARVNTLEADVICITGDIADSPLADLPTFLPILARVRATHGVFAILGNHDHFAGADRVETALQRYTPFTVLRDEHVTLELDGQRLHIVGLDDRGRDWARGVSAVPYLATALATLPAGEPVLLLCHRPDVFPQAAAGGIGLMLSGHTHGGQLAIPWFNGRVRNLAEFITPFARGLFERDGSYLYVNCGLGVTGQRIRLYTPREISLIEVQRHSA